MTHCWIEKVAKFSPLGYDNNGLCSHSWQSDNRVIDVRYHNKWSWNQQLRIEEDVWKPQNLASAAVKFLSFTVILAIKCMLT